MTITFRPAVRSGTWIALGIAGPSRSGKTYSALRVATGLAQGGPIFVIDTESGRARLYADRFKFMCVDFPPPFTSERYMEHIQAAHKAGAAVIIVDSASHEHEGIGGILEQHETELERMAGNDWAKRERVKFTAWIKPKAGHNRYVNTFLQVPSHMIFCFRAKDKLALVKNDKGKQEPISLGWTPICTDRFEYEMTSMLVLPGNAKGVPDLNANSAGLREPLDTMIQSGKPLDEALGKRLAEWARGASTTQPSSAAGHPAPPEPGTARVTPAPETPESPSSAGDAPDDPLDDDKVDLRILADDLKKQLATVANTKALEVMWKVSMKRELDTIYSSARAIYEELKIGMLSRHKELQAKEPTR